jgi:hypothetical protein
MSTKGQTDYAYFDISNAFNIVPHNLLLRKLTTSDFFWLCYLDSQLSDQ